VAKSKVSAEELVRGALVKAALAPDAVKLTGKADGLFPSASGANKAAIDECRDPDRPLLAVVGRDGKAELVALSPAGFERIADQLPDEQVGAVAARVASAAPAAARIDFIQGVLGRTPLAAAELTPLLAEAVAAEKAEQEARVAAAAKRREAEERSRQALERAMQLLESRRRSRVEALRRELAAEGERADDEIDARRDERKPEGGTLTGGKPEPRTDDERDFRRDVAKQLAETWRAAWKDDKQEGRDYLESAMWNVSGLRMIGEPNERTAFDGSRHECATPVFTGDEVRVVRPGWLLEEAEGEFVVVKAAVEKA
jgi:hypothetical protein